MSNLSNFINQNDLNYKKDVNINSSTYTAIANISGDRLATAIRVSINGTTGNVVINCIADILVNHSADGLIKTLSGSYTQLKIKIVSDINSNYTLYAKHLNLNAGGALAAIEIFPLNSETIDFNVTTTYSSVYLEHTTIPGESITNTGAMAAGSGPA